MELELKHIAPYLPYGLKAINQCGNKLDIVGCLDESSVITERDRLKCYDLKYIKPTLRPFSSMTKEEFAELKNKLDGGVLLKLTPKGDIYIKCNDELYLYEVNILNDFLFSNHFDVFGLIEKGLAIEK